MSLYESLMERLEGRQYSNYFSCFCPFDSHKSPALLVYDDGMFVCLSCGKKGNLKYLDKFTGSHFIPSQKVNTVSNVLPRWRKWEEKFGSLEGIVDAAHKSLKRHSQFQTYFRKRKIYEFVDEGHLGYLDGYCLFPVYSIGGRVIEIVARSTFNGSGVRYCVSSRMDSELPLYCPSWRRLDASKSVFVVFGIIDAISLHLANLAVVTGITGKSLSPELLKPLGKRFVIIPDKDEEREGALLANKLGWRARSKNINWPDGTKDCDDIRRIYGNEFLLQTLGA